PAGAAWAWDLVVGRGAGTLPSALSISTFACWASRSSLKLLIESGHRRGWRSRGDTVGRGRYSPRHAADADGAAGGPGRGVGADHLRQPGDGLHRGPGG